MSKVKSFIWSLGSDNLPALIIGIGMIMLVWMFFVGDMVLPAVR